MFVADVTFELPRSGVDAAVSAIEGLLGAWYQNGQLAKDWCSVRRGDSLRVTGLLPEPDALDERNSSQWTRRDAADVIAAGARLLRVEILGEDQDAGPTCGCVVSPSLILVTSWMSRASPVRCGACFRHVPLYRLPPTSGGAQLDLLNWADDYRACDTLQINCSRRERYGELQLARHDSSLSKDGRELGVKLASAMGVRVYYNLDRYRARSAGDERRRRCPSCGGAWRLDEPWHDLFDFRCDACSLVSNVAKTLSTRS